MSECVLPGCRERVDSAGETCGSCVSAFGNWLRPCEVRLTEGEIRSRDAYVERVYHARRAR